MYFTEGELAAWIDLTARVHAERAKREYDLTPEQVAAVQRRLEELKTEARAYWKKYQPELREVRMKLDKLGPPADPHVAKADPAVTEQRRALSRRSGEIMMQQPLHWRMTNPEIEKLLPPEQVEAAQQRQEVRTREMMRTLDATFPAIQSSRPSWRPDIGDLRRVRPELAMGDWAFYVRRFIRVYDLDERQQSTARSVLRELETQRDNHRTAHQDEFLAARNIEDHQERHRKLLELNQPIVKLFDELKTRLDRIPTTGQREAAAKADQERGAPTTRPAGSSTHPAPP